MTATIDTLDPTRPKRVALVASNAAISPVTGWPVGFWWSELTHSYWEFREHGYQVDLFSPEGGELQADAWSDPRDPSGYSADDLISLGFIHSPDHNKLVQNSRPLKELNVPEHDALFLVGGQGPMVTFYDDARVQDLVASFYEAGCMTALVCHATCVLLKARLSNGALLVQGKTWTGFANSEEDYADAFVGRRIQPFWIEEQARKLSNTNFIVNGRFRAHAVRDGLLVTGQQQYSGAAAARLVIRALGE
jgi:putative intracellular protease/amidase